MAPHSSIMAFDAFPKTLDELKERTVGGALISVLATFLIATLFFSELRDFRRIETVDQLDVDVTSHGKIAINVDIYLPSLPCSEFVVDLTDESGVQQLHATDNLMKMRMDRHGAPLDVAARVDWGHAVAPAFRHRKMVGLLDDVSSQLQLTLQELEEDKRSEGRRGDTRTHEEHKAHRRKLSHRAQVLSQRVDQLSSATMPDEQVQEALHLTRSEVYAIRKHIEELKLYSAEHTEDVTENLATMEKNLLRLQTSSEGVQAENIKEALRLRIDILQDNLKGFVDPEDLERRERYRQMDDLLETLHNSTAFANMDEDERNSVFETVVTMQAALDELADGATADARESAEQRLKAHLEVLQGDLLGRALPEDYCGSCYGASRDPTACCNTCDDVKLAYRTRRWSMPNEKNFEQCKREDRRREVTFTEGEGCAVYGTIQVHRSSGNLYLAPASSAKHSATGTELQQAGLTFEDARRFNVSHRINRLSFGEDFPGQVNPLDGVERMSPLGPAVARYFIKVVPTVYRSLRGKALDSNQFATTEYFKAVSEEDRSFQVPGIHFAFDITPLRVKLTEKRGRTFVSFFVRCAATLGGIFTVAGMIDKMLYSSQRLIMKKLEIGKAS